MLAEIEQQMLQRVSAKGLPVDTTGATLPAAYARVDGGAISKVSQTHMRMDVTARLTVAFSGTSPETTRRTTVYPVIEQALGILTLQTLGLDIDPLVPAGVQDSTGTVAGMDGLIVYRLDFSTHYYFRKVDDETPVDLLKVDLAYHLQDPGDDGVKDAEDVINVGG